MGHEDHERKFEQALERHLRRDAAGARNEADAHTDGQDETGAVACPDAETLAAFHDRALTNEEMNATKHHIAECSRCQEVLEQLEATDEIPLRVEAQSDLKMSEPKVSASTILRAPKDISRGRGFKALRWAAPAGAIAAGLLIWFFVRHNTQMYVNKSEPIQVAKQQPADQSLREEPPAPASATRQTDSNSKASAPRRNPQALSHAPAALAPTLAPANKPSATFPATSSETVIVESSPPMPSEQQQSSSRNTPSSRNGDVAATADKKDRSTTESVEVSAASQSVTVESAPTDAVSPPQLPTTSGNIETEAKQNAVAGNKKESATNTPPATTVQNLPIYGRAVTSLQTLNPGVRTVAAPGGNILWRMSGNGKIERSADRGVTWIQHDTGDTQELVSGSAPDDQIFWVAGRHTILRTTDAGAHWAKFVPPPAPEIGGIVAVDALRATLTDANGRAMFTTTDGGLTWAEAKK